MGCLYHYTKLGNLYGIVKPNIIIWWAKFYKYYKGLDYTFIKEKARPIIEEISREKNWRFDFDAPAYEPYIISFCKDGNSDYMWEEFGNHHKGISIIINDDILKDQASLLSTKAPALIIPCEYYKSNWNKEDMKEKILKIASCESLANSEYEDKLLFAIMGLIQNDMCEEQEIRYIIPKLEIGKYTISNNEIKFFPNIVPKDQYDKPIEFPKELLLGVIVGKETTKEEYEKAQDYLLNCGYPRNIVYKEQTI